MPPMGPGYPAFSGNDYYRDRRRTVHSIRDLPSQQNGLADGWRTLSFNSYQPDVAIDNYATRQSEEARVRQLRRRSLPSQGYHQQGYQPRPQPLVHLTSDDTPALYRSNTDPTAGKQVRFQEAASSSRGVPVGPPGGHYRRRSLNSSARNRHSQGPPLSTVTEGQQTHELRPRSGILYFDPLVNYAQQPPNTNGQAQPRPTDGWNAQRERERMRREQEATTARLMQARERERKAAGMEPNPYALPSSAKRHIGYPQQPPQHVIAKPLSFPHNPHGLEAYYSQVAGPENPRPGWTYPSVVKKPHRTVSVHSRAGSTSSHHSNMPVSPSKTQPSVPPNTPRTSLASTRQHDSAVVPGKGRLETFPSLTHLPGEPSTQTPQTTTTTTTTQSDIPLPPQVPRRTSKPLCARFRSLSQPQQETPNPPPSPSAAPLHPNNPSVKHPPHHQHQPDTQSRPGFDTMATWKAKMALSTRFSSPSQTSARSISMQQQRTPAAMKSAEIVLEKEKEGSTSTSTATSWSSSSSSSAAAPSGKVKRKWRRSWSLTRGFVSRVFGGASGSGSD